jgi:hypothetical protein
MSNQLVICLQRSFDLTSIRLDGNWLPDLYGSLWGLRIELRAYATKLFYLIKDVAPVLLATEIINIAFGMIDLFGLSEYDKQEVKQWLLDRFSDL